MKTTWERIMGEKNEKKNAWLKGRENIREKKIRYDEAKREIE